MPPFPEKESSLLNKLESRATVADAIGIDASKKKQRAKANLDSVTSIAHGGSAPAASAAPAATPGLFQPTRSSVFFCITDSCIEKNV